MKHRSHLRPGDAGLAARLRREIEGEVWFDPGTRGRYSTDASIYQIEPIGVVAPRSAEDIARTIAICREAGAPVLPRGAGTSQCGQTVGEAVVVDTSRYLDQVLGVDEESRRVAVQPGVVLDRLNAWLKPKGLFFPVDVSPANRATIGGMAGNNSWRRALHPLRQHGAQRARDQRHPRGRERGAVRRGLGQPRGVHRRRPLLGPDPSHACAGRP